MPEYEYIMPGVPSADLDEEGHLKPEREEWHRKHNPNYPLYEGEPLTESVLVGEVAEAAPAADNGSESQGEGESQSEAPAPEEEVDLEAFVAGLQHIADVASNAAEVLDQPIEEAPAPEQAAEGEAEAPQRRRGRNQE